MRGKDLRQLDPEGAEECGGIRSRIVDTRNNRVGEQPLGCQLMAVMFDWVNLIEAHL